MGKINRVAFVNSFKFNKKKDNNFHYKLYLISYICENNLEKAIIDRIFDKTDIDIGSFCSLKRAINNGYYKNKSIELELPPIQDKHYNILKRFIINILLKLIN